MLSAGIDEKRKRTLSFKRRKKAKGTKEEYASQRDTIKQELKATYFRALAHSTCPYPSCAYRHPDVDRQDCVPDPDVGALYVHTDFASPVCRDRDILAGRCAAGAEAEGNMRSRWAGSRNWVE